MNLGFLLKILNSTSLSQCILNQYYWYIQSIRLNLMNFFTLDHPKIFKFFSFQMSVRKLSSHFFVPALCVENVRALTCNSNRYLSVCFWLTCCICKMSTRDGLANGVYRWNPFAFFFLFKNSKWKLVFIAISGF